MSQRRQPKPVVAKPHAAQAAVFAALGDPTRLELLRELSLSAPRSISDLASEARITRQAITKHLHVLESAGLVEAERHGREVRFHFTPEPVNEASRFLESVAQQWDQALARLKSFLETEPA